MSDLPEADQIEVCSVSNCVFHGIQLSFGTVMSKGCMQKVWSFL